MKVWLEVQERNPQKKRIKAWLEVQECTPAEEDNENLAQSDRVKPPNHHHPKEDETSPPAPERRE